MPNGKGDSRARTVVRLLSDGTHVRVRLLPLPNDRVVVVEYHRKKRAAGHWQRDKTEEGRVSDLTQVLPGTSATELWPTAVWPTT